MTSYLSRVSSAVYRKDWEKRKCQFLARMVYRDKETKRTTYSMILVHQISEGTAVFQTDAEEVPKHFYIAIGTFQHYIGAALTGREKESYKAEFIKEQPTKLVDTLARMSSPGTALKDLSVMLKDCLD